MTERERPIVELWYCYEDLKKGLEALLSIHDRLADEALLSQERPGEEERREQLLCAIHLAHQHGYYVGIEAGAKGEFGRDSVDVGDEYLGNLSSNVTDFLFCICTWPHPTDASPTVFDPACPIHSRYVPSTTEGHTPTEDVGKDTRRERGHG